MHKFGKIMHIRYGFTEKVVERYFLKIVTSLTQAHLPSKIQNLTLR